MGRVLLAAVAWGLVGMTALPTIIYVSILGLSHLLDPRCATTGGGSGCVAGGLGIALASVMPAFALFFLIGVVAGRQRLRHRMARDFEAILDAPDGHRPDEDRA